MGWSGGVHDLEVDCTLGWEVLDGQEQAAARPEQVARRPAPLAPPRPLRIFSEEPVAHHQRLDVYLRLKWHSSCG
jgi:hypothetical protein